MLGLTPTPHRRPTSCAVLSSPTPPSWRSPRPSRSPRGWGGGRMPEPPSRRRAEHVERHSRAARVEPRDRRGWQRTWLRTLRRPVPGAHAVPAGAGARCVSPPDGSRPRFQCPAAADGLWPDRVLPAARLSRPTARSGPDGEPAERLGLDRVRRRPPRRRSRRAPPNSADVVAAREDRTDRTTEQAGTTWGSRWQQCVITGAGRGFAGNMPLFADEGAKVVVSDFGGDRPAPAPTCSAAQGRGRDHRPRRRGRRQPSRRRRRRPGRSADQAGGRHVRRRQRPREQRRDPSPTGWCS